MKSLFMIAVMLSAFIFPSCQSTDKKETKSMNSDTAVVQPDTSMHHSQ